MTKPEQDGPDLAALLPLLAGLPRPQLPAEVATRLDAAIARAAAERVETGGRAPATAPQRPSQSPWRRRLRTLVLASGAAGVLLGAGLLISSAVSQSDSGASSSAASAGERPDVTGLSTAPVTDPGLLSWAAGALQGQPKNSGQVARPGFSTLATPGAQVATPTHGAAADGDAAACLSATQLFQPAMEQRQLLSSASGEFEGRPAILLVYSNGSDATTAYIVVFAAPCEGPSSVLLSSGVVPQ